MRDERGGEKNNKYFYQIVSAADTGIPSSVLSPSYKSQIDGSEGEQIDQVKIFHILAIFVFNHFRLQTLISTKRDAEIVPFNSTFLILIIFILNSKFASVLNCLH